MSGFPLPEQEESVEIFPELVAALMQVGDVFSHAAVGTGVSPLVRAADAPDGIHDRQEVTSNSEGDSEQELESRYSPRSVSINGDPIHCPQHGPEA